MRLEMECAVEAHTSLTETITVHRADRTYIFIPDKDGLLSKIKIQCPVSDPEKFYSDIGSGPEGSLEPVTMIVGKDEELLQSIVREFQELESLMALYWGMVRAHWDTARYAVIPETDEERANTKILGWNLTERSAPPEIMPISQLALETVVNSRQTAHLLIVPMAFYREGQNDFEAKRYINAFFNFYFVVEGLFGDGETKNSKVADAFRSSPAFGRVLEMVTSGPELIVDRPAIDRMLAHRAKQFNADGIIDLLIKTRGTLHHFSNNPNRLHGTPFTQAQFKAISSLLMTICFLSLGCYFKLPGNER